MNDQTPRRKNADGSNSQDMFSGSSLLDDVVNEQAEAKRAKEEGVREAKRARVAALRYRARRVVTSKITIAVVSLLIVAGITVGAISLVPTAKPDPWGEEVADVADFVFDEDFNRLPPRERLGFLVELIKRFRDFDEDDAVALSTLLAQMNETMRAQIEENMRRLAVDLMSESAREYAELSPEERAAYLNQLLLEIDMLGDDISGRERDDTESDRLARMQNQAQRDQERARRRGSESLQAERVQGFFEMYQDTSNEVGAVDRGRIGVLMRDMSRHLRGESLDR
ncbi:MAG: hypothetical protein ACOC0P_02485 [Planctomycetota bacterium]